ncbi:MAG: PAS domain S-box protein [Candidatus ainarchaeum sp.]|nr:PAS domain S-box protein [Candidatus ainarchaeum sp.]
MKISTRLALFFIITMAVAIGALGWFYAENAREAIAERTDAQLASIGLVKIAQFEYYKADEMGHLERVAGRIAGYSGSMKAALGQELAAQPDFDSLFVMGLDGTVVASTDPGEEGLDVSKEAYFANGLAGTSFVSRFYPPEYGRPAAYFITTPLKDAGGSTIAVLGARLSMKTTSALMLESAGMGNTGEVFLADSYGVPITGLKKTRNDTNPLHTQAVSECLDGNNGSATYPDYHGDLVIERYYWLQDNGMCLISKIDSSEALAPIRQINSAVLLVTLALLLLALAAAILAIRRVFAPIDELTSVVSAISKGDMRSDLDPKMKESNDEIGKLARAFDRTLVSLKLAMKETAPQLKIESKALREALEERTKAEQRYRALIKTSPDAVIVTDPAGIINEISARTLGVFGAGKPSDLLGTDVYGLLPPDARDEARRAITKVLDAQGEMNGVKLTMQRKDGATFTGEVNINRLKDAAGMHIGTIITLRDITRRESEDKALREALAKADKAEKELEGERNLANKYLDIADVILVAIGADQKVTLINRKGCEVLGYKEPEIIGKNWFEKFIPKKARKRTEETFGKLMAGEIKEVGYYENEVLAKNGEEKLIAWHNTILRDDGRRLGTLSSGEDITRRRFTEERLGTLGRLYAMTEEIGHMATDARRKGLGTGEIFGKMCSILVDKGGFRMAWIGLADARTRKVTPLAHAGMERGYLDNIKISTDNVPEGQGPTGTAIRENMAVIIDDWATDPRMKMWRAEGAKRGYRSSAAFPLRKEGRAVGALNVYSEKPGFFDHETIRALEGVVDMAAAAAFTLKTSKKRRT